eukprot:g8781.t1
MLQGTQVAVAVRWHRSCRRLLSSVAAVLESRAVIEISGADAKALLQGLMTNDMSLLDDGDGGRPCIPAAFLNPKGRVLGDALVTRSPRQAAKRKPGYLLDCPQSVAEGLKTHLKLYKLRSKVKIKDATPAYDVLVSGVQDPWQAAAAGSEEGGGWFAAPENAAAQAQVEAEAGAVGRVARFADPRCVALGVRVIRPKGSSDDSWPDGDTVVPENRYDALRMVNGVGEGSELVDSIPLESNLDLLGAISFTKGCYVGQELTARTQFKGFVRKRVLPVLFPVEGADASASPIRISSSVAADGGDRQGPILLQAWGAGKGEVAPPPPEADSKIVDRAAEDGKVGTLVKASPEYNVGLALLRLGKIMSTSGPDGSANPAVDCCVLGGAGQGEEELQRRCLPLTPPWWPVDLDPATGKVPA